MRQFLDRMDKPRVDEIRGIPPAIAIEQANPGQKIALHRRHDDGDQRLPEAVLAADRARVLSELRPRDSPGNAKSIADQVIALFHRPHVIPSEARARAKWSREIPTQEPAGCARDSSTPEDESHCPHHLLGRRSGENRAARFLQFLQQQGYLRVWLDGEIVRADTDAKIKRLGARVQVIQDRIAISEENRARLIEAIETALRFGKGKIKSFRFVEQAVHAISKTRPTRPPLQVANSHSPPAGIARIAISIFVRRRPDCSASTIRLAPVRNAAASAARSRSI